MNFSVVIPAHNEENSIEEVIRCLEQGVKGNYEILVVDDHSSDKTVQIVKKLASEYNNISLVPNKEEAGFANAIRTGFSNARTDIVVPVMADLCDDPNIINKMYEKLLEEGFDIVCGSRYMKDGKKIGGPLLKSLFSKFYGISLYFLLGIPTHDIANAFKMYRKEVIDAILLESKGFEILVELPLKAFFLGYRITELPTIWRDRKEGRSKFRLFQQGLRYFRFYIWALKKKLDKC